MRPSLVFFVSLTALLGSASLLHTAHERGYIAGQAGDTAFAVTDVAGAAPRTPWARSAAADSRPLRDPVGNPADAIPNAKADALYLASAFAPGELRMLKPREALVRIELPDGRKLEMTCAPGRASQNCIRRVTEALDPHPVAETVVEAQPKDESP